jgi:hypothetical protein
MMGALQRLLTNGETKPALPDEVESAVNGVLREAEELCRVLRHRRERRRTRADAPIQ